MTEKQGVIYGIRHKADDKICYVGQTRVKPETRWKQYLSGKTPMSRAVQLFGTMDEFEFSIIERVPEAQLNEREVYWIAELETLHPNGMNRNTGGFSRHLAASARASMAEAARVRMADPEYRAKMAAAVWANTEHQKKMSAASRERQSSPEVKAAIAEKTASSWADQEVRAKRLAALRSPEVIAKISETSKRRKHSPETRAKIAAANRNRKHSSETRAKIAASVRRTKAGG